MSHIVGVLVADAARYASVGIEAEEGEAWEGMKIVEEVLEVLDEL